MSASQHDAYCSEGDLCATCWEHHYGRSQQPAPTAEDYCAAGGHGYYGDDAGRGRCYCGSVKYPSGGPVTTEGTK